MKARLVRLKGSLNYRKWYIKELMKAAEVRYLKPQRMLSLPYEEEALRCKLTWQQFDRQMWLIAFGGEDNLKHLVVDAKHLADIRKDTVIGFSDQVPWWGLVGSTLRRARSLKTSSSATSR